MKKAFTFCIWYAEYMCIFLLPRIFVNSTQRVVFSGQIANIYNIQVVKIFAAREEDFLLRLFTSSCILGVDYSQNASSGHYSHKTPYGIFVQYFFRMAILSAAVATLRPHTEFLCNVKIEVVYIV